MHSILTGKKVIFFDVGYTLDRPISNDWMFTEKFKARTAERMRLCSKEQIERARAEGADYLAKNHLTHTVEEECDRFYHYYSIVSEGLSLGLRDDELRELASDRTFNMDNYAIYPDTREALEALHGRFRLGIISDTWPSIELQLTSLGIREYFSFVTYSFDFGVYKPDRRLFLDALGKCGAPAEETVFIDDGPPILEGAAKLGITPILIAANPASDVETPYTKLHALSELIR